MNETKVNDLVEGVVVKIYPTYAIVLLANRQTGLLHISEASNTFIHRFNGYIKVGYIYKFKIIFIDEKTNFIKLSLKQLTLEEKHTPFIRQKISEERISFDKLKESLINWVDLERKKI